MYCDGFVIWVLSFSSTWAISLFPVGFTPYLDSFSWGAGNGVRWKRRVYTNTFNVWPPNEGVALLGPGNDDSRIRRGVREHVVGCYGSGVTLSLRRPPWRLRELSVSRLYCQPCAPIRVVSVSRSSLEGSTSWSQSLATFAVALFWRIYIIVVAAAWNESRSRLFLFL